MRLTRSSRAPLLTFALALGLTACASGGGGTSASHGSSTRITADELDTVAELDLLSAVRRLRPQWLRPGTRGTLPQVVMNGTQLAGGVDALGNIRATDVSELQFMNASDATTRYGTGFTAGAIVISTRR